MNSKPGKLWAAAMALLLLLALGVASAQERVVKVGYGYFPEARPIHTACARGFFDFRLPSQNVLYQVTCYPQTSGGFASSRLDNGQLQIAQLGSTPAAEAIARGVDLKLVYLSHYMGESQGIYVRPDEIGYQGVRTPFDLFNRTIGVPFLSTMHYQALFLVDLFGLTGSVTLLDLSPSQIIQAWDEKTIDAAACWGRPRQHVLANGGARTLVTSRDLSNWGVPTFVVIAVQSHFAQQHSDFLTHFVAIMSRINDSYLDRLGATDSKNILRWDAQAPAGTSFMPSLVDALMLSTETPKSPKQATIQDQRQVLDLYHQLNAATQQLCLYLGSCEETNSLIEETLHDTAEFLLQQKVIATLDPLKERLKEAIDGTFLARAHRDCSNCFRVGTYQALAGSNNLLAELERLDAESGKSPFAVSEVGRTVKGDSSCQALATIAGSESAIQGSISDGASASPGRSYSDNLHCNWVIQSPDNGDSAVQLSFSSLRLWSEDYVRVYSDPISKQCQPGAVSNVLEAQLSGFYDEASLPTIRAKGCLLVSFDTDSNAEKWYGDGSNGDGFYASYHRRAPGCIGPQDCSGHPCSSGLCDCEGTAWTADCSKEDFCMGTNRLVLNQGDKQVLRSSSHVTIEAIQSGAGGFYPNDLDCTWDISIPNQGLALRVTVFHDLEECRAGPVKHCEELNGKCKDGFCICSGGIPCTCSCAGNAPNNLAAKVGTTFGVVVPLFLLMIGGFLLYRRRKILSSREQKRIIAEKDAELAAFRDTIVGICVAVREYVPEPALDTSQGGARARKSSLRLSKSREPPKVVWCWQETEHVMNKHDPSTTFGDPKDCWIKYDRKNTAILENAYLEHQLGHSKQINLRKDYVVDLETMEQTKVQTGFQRKVQRVVLCDSKPSRDLDLSGAHFGDELPKELKGDPQVVLVKDDLMQISKKRPDGWVFGTKMYHADEAAARNLVKLACKDASSSDDTNILTDTGWFQEEATSVPTKEQLSALQIRVGDANALDAPDYWSQVTDPTVAERIRLSVDSSEALAVLDAFKATLVPPRFTHVKIVSIDRIQNLAMWQSYVVKRQTICYRETEGKQDGTSRENQKEAQRRVERRWLWHGTNVNVMEKILQQGFNRSFCGKNATMYGKGVYYARDSSYSAHKIYAVPDSHGNQYMLACRVVVGEYCKGVQDALTPRVRDSRTNMLYDSTVDSTSNPTIYVTYHDSQSYPEYLIRFQTS